MSDTDLVKVAKKVRKNFESGIVFTKELGELYVAYNHEVGDIDLFLESARVLFPRLNCGLASVALQKELGFGEVVTGFYGSNKHTFLQVSPTRMVCITSDQYGGPSVYVGTISTPWMLNKDLVV